MRFCTNCGKQLSENAAFCTNCGTRFEAPVSKPQAVEDFSTPPQPEPIPVIPTPVEPPVQDFTEQPACAQPPIQPTVRVQNQPPINSSVGMNFDFNTNTATPTTRTMYEYKVLSQKDKWFSGKFDPLLLEQAINSYAMQGWRVIGCATADIPAFGSTRQEFITLLEREK